MCWDINTQRVVFFVCLLCAAVWKTGFVFIKQNLENWQVTLLNNKRFKSKMNYIPLPSRCLITAFSLYHSPLCCHFFSAHLCTQPPLQSSTAVFFPSFILFWVILPLLFSSPPPPISPSKASFCSEGGREPCFYLMMHCHEEKKFDS